MLYKSFWYDSFLCVCSYANEISNFNEKRSHMTKVLIFIFFLNPRWRRCVSVILLETGYLFFMRKIFNFRCLWIIGIIFDLQTMNLIFRVTFLLENINMYHYQYLIKITTNNNPRENCIGFKKTMTQVTRTMTLLLRSSISRTISVEH